MGVTVPDSLVFKDSVSRGSSQNRQGNLTFVIFDVSVVNVAVFDGLVVMIVDSIFLPERK
jgi:hypothetical protein